jgi:hypothetical protein
MSARGQQKQNRQGWLVLRGTVYFVERPIVVLPSARAAVVAMGLMLAHVLDTCPVCPAACRCGPSVENLRKHFMAFNRHAWNNKGGAVRGLQP